MAMITSPQGVLAVLVGVAAFYFLVAERTGWKMWDFFPPLIWIYATPVLLSNLGVLTNDFLTPLLVGESPVYDALRMVGLPMFIVLMLINVDVGAAIRVMGKGVLVMLLGTVGIVVGAVVSYAVVSRWLSPDAWSGFGALAGSWIGGTGNMAAAKEALGTSPEQFGLAILADNVVYVVWLPILLGSKAFAERFNRWARVKEGRIEAMEEAVAAETVDEERPVRMVDYLYLGALAGGVTWISHVLAGKLPEVDPILSTSTWNILLVTTLALVLSRTPLRRLPGSHNLAMALIYVFVAAMGAQAKLSGLAQAPAFLAGAFLWITIHGLFCVAGAWIFRVDIHSVAIASAANVGGAASAPVVAAYHRESLVPASILMALIGYALGNYLAILTGQLCRLVG
jgi:uncharacterized membrane protein